MTETTVAMIAMTMLFGIVAGALEGVGGNGCDILVRSPDSTTTIEVVVKLMNCFLRAGAIPCRRSPSAKTLGRWREIGAAFALFKYRNA